MQSGARRVQSRLAGCGESDTAPITYDEGRANDLLQRLHCMAYGRLRKTEPLGGFREAARLAERCQDAHHCDVDISFVHGCRNIFHFAHIKERCRFVKMRETTLEIAASGFL